MQITPTNGFTGTINLSCSGLPSGATCSPAQVNVSGSCPVAFTLTIATTARTTTAGITTDTPVFPGRGPTLVAVFVFVLGIGMVSAGGQPRRQFVLVTVMLILVGAGFVACCGSHPTGTPAGTYPVLLTATSGSLTHTANLTLTVN